MSHHWQFIVPNFWPKINSTIIIVYFALCKFAHDSPGYHIAVNSVFHVLDSGFLGDLELNSRFHKQTFRNPDYFMGAACSVSSPVTVRVLSKVISYFLFSDLWDFRFASADTFTLKGKCSSTANAFNLSAQKSRLWTAENACWNSGLKCSVFTSD